MNLGIGFICKYLKLNKPIFPELEEDWQCRLLIPLLPKEKYKFRKKHAYFLSRYFSVFLKCIFLVIIMDLFKCFHNVYMNHVILFIVFFFIKCFGMYV